MFQLNKKIKLKKEKDSSIKRPNFITAWDRIKKVDKNFKLTKSWLISTVDFIAVLFFGSNSSKARR